MKRLSMLVVCLLSLTACRSHATKHTKVSSKFEVPNISSSLAYRPDWETTSLNKEESKELDAILDQKFTYCGRGGQCWVFASADSKYVIKFFKYDRMRTQGYKKTIERTFCSYKLSYDVLRQETGVVYLHLNKTQSLHKTITVRDDRHRHFKIDLDDKEFLIQRKAKQIFPAISAHMKKGQIDSAKQLLSSVIQLVIARSDKGIKDLDPFPRNNCGCFDDQAVFIDVGSFIPDESLKSPEGRKKEVARVMDRFMNWLKRDYPELAKYVAQELDRL
jgi:hypothetical protein